MSHGPSERFVGSGEQDTAKVSAQWYKEYYLRKGSNRNDILMNRGVLFQSLAFQKSVIEALRTVPISRNWKILDVGCGSGASLLQFLAFGFHPGNLYGIDIIPERIQEAQERWPTINFAHGDAVSMEYESDFFDMVMQSGMFFQTRDDNRARLAADEMLRVVKPGGHIMLIDWRYNYGHPECKRLSRTRIVQLFQVGTKTSILCCTSGALIPPLGRFLSTYLSSSYFVVQRLLPFLVGQVTTILSVGSSSEDPATLL